MSRPDAWWWLVPVLTASLGLGALQAATSLAAARGFIFIGGPLLLLAGLHARLEDFLHARARLVLLPLPIVPARHRRAAVTRHRRGLWITIALGSAGIVAASHLQRWSWPATTGLVFDWLWLAALAYPLERAIPGANAWLGRRYAPASPLGRLQRQASGGWTTPEAAVHLYSPALALVLAAALAMPGQLLADRFVDGHPLPDGWPLVLAIPLVIALALAAVARRLYEVHLFASVPWLAEAMRRLSGLATAPPVPGWVSRWPAPALRLLWLQLFRLAPAPRTRLLALVAAAVWATHAPTSAGPLATWIATVVLWIVPMRRFVRARGDWSSFAASLPVRSPVVLGPRTLVVVPVVATALAVAIAATITATIAQEAP